MSTFTNEQRCHDEIKRNRWSPSDLVEELKPRARVAGLWKLFLPDEVHGAGLTNLEYAPSFGTSSSPSMNAR
jgi:acyl-CoA dehydrogenase